MREHQIDFSPGSLARKYIQNEYLYEKWNRFKTWLFDTYNIKSTRLKEVDIPQNLDLLNKWTIPKVNIKTIYDYGWFDKISNKQLIKTTEQSLALNCPNALFVY
ncbi:hypothetical protein H5410_061333 [Solanum commersonii]|uniref:Uncharacterized protein n=1 Tax=Solanum commersonii TaxID=4109 RepID=A0A9J5W8A9_SOLCO|nr:hypothetical protein H5410_061333 [Solanum commersonii]